MDEVEMTAPDPTAWPPPAQKGQVSDKPDYTPKRTVGLLRGRPKGSKSKPVQFSAGEINWADFAKKDGSEVEIYRWVFDNMGIHDPDKATCPGPGAWAYLMHCRADSDARNDFYTRHAKLLPSKTQMNQGNPYEDDGAGIERLLVRVQRGLEQGNTETSAPAY